jgi:membrane protease YdiL (CAAX protease family)
MKFLQQAFDKQNQWWKYLVVFLVALFGGQIIGAIPLVIVMVIQSFKSGSEGLQALQENPMDLTSLGISKNVSLFLMMITMVVVLILAIILIKAFHRRSFAQTVNGTKKIRWKRVGMGAAVWALINAIALGLCVIFENDIYVLQFNLVKFIPLMIISLIMIPLQTTAEELLFRGYLTQGVAGWTRNRWMAILIPGILFALMRLLNPEVKAFGFSAAMPQYLAFGLVFGLVSVLDDGIELAMGIHAGNNVFLSLFITNQSSILQTDAVFFQTTVDIHKESLIMFVMCILVVAFFAWKYKWDFRLLNKKVEPAIDDDATLTTCPA